MSAVHVLGELDNIHTNSPTGIHGGRWYGLKELLIVTSFLLAVLDGALENLLGDRPYSE